MPKQVTKTVYTFKELLEMKQPTTPIPKTGWTFQAMPDEKAIEKARQWLMDGQTDHEWWEYTYETWKNALDQIGFCDADISFSGFWSQGDGASFTANVDLERLVAFCTAEIASENSIMPIAPSLFGHDEDFRPWLTYRVAKPFNPRYRFLLWAQNSIYCAVKRTSSQYVHWNTCTVEAELRDDGDFDDSNEKLTGRWSTGTWISKTPRIRALFDEFVVDIENLRKELCQAIYEDLKKEYEYLTSDEALIETAEANNYTFDIHGRPEL